MKAVMVRYTVKPEFADTNAANIQRVMEELRAKGDDGIRYQSFRQSDGVTFVHFGMYADQAALDRMGESEAFAAFQKALKGSGPVSPPNAEWLDIVGSSYPIF